jgi:hypothetical protein
VNSRERITRPEKGAGTHSGTGSTPPPGSGALNDVVSRSVDLGYRVIDEYIRQGQKAAQRFNDRSYGASAVTSDMQEIATRMAQYASDFTALWFEFMQVAAAGAGGWPMPPANESKASARASTGPATPPATAPAPAEGDGVELTRVRIAVTSPHPTEVSLDLRPHIASRRLVVQSLRAVDPDKPRLSDVTIEDGGPDEPLTLRIRVPTGQAAGVYNGLIIDGETSRPVGTVSLRIAPE